ncbi:hypothetical protein MAM1_0011d01187 [Mucor ambiguus]|uniref:Uncharacterized protein n=1 Tax=Mucor ambiguus TaxID=91626 RepID=A0A0C9MFC6_9FUNG|nr:hypothetical protein MAM1_0011d01187 [Mucor ambiguus]
MTIVGFLNAQKFTVWLCFDATSPKPFSQSWWPSNMGLGLALTKSANLRFLRRYELDLHQDLPVTKHARRLAWLQEIHLGSP